MNSLEVAILSESSSLKLAGAARRLTSPLWMRCFLRCFWVINSRVVKCARCGKEEADGAGRCPHCDARPLAVGPPVWPRALGALAAGSLIYLCTLYRGLAYDQRGHDCRPPPDNTYIVGGRVVLRPCDPGLPFEFFIFSGLMLAAGFALALRIPRLRYTVASLILAWCLRRPVVRFDDGLADRSYRPQSPALRGYPSGDLRRTSLPWRRRRPCRRRVHQATRRSALARSGTFGTLVVDRSCGHRGSTGCNTDCRVPPYNYKPDAHTLD